MALVLAILTGWRGYAIVLAVGLALGWIVQGWRWGADVAGMKRDQAQALTVAHEQARAKEHEWAVKLNKVESDAQKQERDAAARLAASDDTLGRLRGELAATKRRASSAAAAPRRQSKPGDDPIGVFADMYGRLAERDRAVSDYADRLRIAGLACERSHDEVTP